MATDNTPTATGGPAEKASRWADNEKVSISQVQSWKQWLIWLTLVDRSLGCDQQVHGRQDRLG